jgi:putative ABC transport system ATP-binding protein
VSESTPRLELRNVSKTFFPYTVNERVALDDISLKVADGDFITIIGSNGAGKSTLLSVVAGVYRPEKGSVLFDGADVTRQSEFARSRRLARVFQDPMVGTAPDLSVEENLAVAYRRGKSRGLGLGIPRSTRASFREELSVLGLGLENRLTTKVGYLSGGQRQALSLVMATFSNPSVLLLDEHTAALDPARAELIVRLTQHAVTERHLTTLMVTHNMSQAIRMGNRLIMMHEGKIVLDLRDEQKSNSTVEWLMGEFTRLTHQASDRSLLS